MLARLYFKLDKSCDEMIMHKNHNTKLSYDILEENDSQ